MKWIWQTNQNLILHTAYTYKVMCIVPWLAKKVCAGNCDKKIEWMEEQRTLRQMDMAIQNKNVPLFFHKP